MRRQATRVPRPRCPACLTPVPPLPLPCHAALPPPRPCPLQLRRGVEFATACGAFTCTKPGAIGAQPTAAEAEALLAEKSSAT